MHDIVDCYCSNPTRSVRLTDCNFIVRMLYILLSLLTTRRHDRTLSANTDRRNFIYRRDLFLKIFLT